VKKPLPNSYIPSKKVLLVDDDPDCRLTTRLFLAQFGYTVDAVDSAERALKVFNPLIHDVVVTDNSMPGITGREMAYIIKMRSPETPIVMYTGNPPEECACVDFMLKRPAHLLLLKEGIDQVLGPSPASC
jgi:CheY-like chemotaxis protein